MSEQDDLARLVGGGADLEPVQTADLLADGLMQSLGKPNGAALAEATAQIANGEEKTFTPIVPRQAQSLKPQASAPKYIETVLLRLYDINDGLIKIFESVNISDAIAAKLTEEIKNVEFCIVQMGGELEKFVPLNHTSGLLTPNFAVNAQKVIETTIQCYSAGEVKDLVVSDDGKKIDVVFSGTSGDVQYVARGEVDSDEWMGNEALDYIYTTQGGKMSVKSFSQGRWVDQSENKKYNVSWELKTSSVNFKESDNKIEIKKEDSLPSQKSINIVKEDAAQSNKDIGDPI